MGLAHSVCPLLFSGLVHAAPPVVAPTTLPTGGQVVAGNATISSTTTANNAVMNINQTSQRAVVNWDSFNVGKNATVNFNQPNANAVTLNRVTGATASVIDGAIKANGQVILVNPNGVTFGRGSEVHAAAVVASTLNMADKEFMEGKHQFKDDGTGVGNKAGKIINKGTISTNQTNNDNGEGGFIALLAPEVRNQGYLLAQKGGTVAIGSGSHITLHIQGQSLVAIKVEESVYHGLISNKRIIEAPGGLVVLATGAANQLMAGIIKNTGKISADSLVNNGGVIELVAKNVTQAGTASANSQTKDGGQINLIGQEITVAKHSQTTATGATGGGQVNIGLANTQVSGGTQVNSNAPSKQAADQAQALIKANADQASSKNQLAKTVTIEQNASIDTSATQAGNGGSIAIWSELKTTVAGILKSMGGALSGSGGFIETSSKGQVVLAPTVSINTSANNQTGKAGTWLLDPVDLLIDAPAASVISSALSSGNVTIEVTANTTGCSLGSCILNGSGNLTIASDILKAGNSYTTLTLNTVNTFSLWANITGQNLDVIISSSIAYLGVGSSITASMVTVQAQTIVSRGSIQTSNYLFGGGAGSLGNAIQLLAEAIFVTGTLRINNGAPLVPLSVLDPTNLSPYNVDQNLNKIYSSTAANDPSSLVVTPVSEALSNAIYLTSSAVDRTMSMVILESTAQVLANGTTGGSIYIKGTSIDARAGSLIQANGTSGVGGMIGMKADRITVAGELSAGGFTDGGAITLISTDGLLNLQDSLIQANGGSGNGGSINAQALGISSLLANSAGTLSSGIDLSKIIFVREVSTSGLAGSVNLRYEFVDSTGSIITLGAGIYANLAIGGTPSYVSNSTTITNLIGAGNYTDLLVKGLFLTGVDSGHFMLVSIPVSLIVSPATVVAIASSFGVVAAPPPPPPPPALFSPPPPAKLGVSLGLVPPPVAPRPAPNSSTSAPGGEAPVPPPVHSHALTVMADGSVALIPPPPPPALGQSVATSGNPLPQSPPLANVPSNKPTNRPAPGSRESLSNSLEGGKLNRPNSPADKQNPKEAPGKAVAGPAKYVSKYANGVRNNNKPVPKESSTKSIAANKSAPPREGKYSGRINVMNSNPTVIASMTQNPFAGNISPFPVGVPNEVPTHVVLRGGDSLAQSYDDVPSIRNSGVANVGRSKTTENYHESLESVNLMSTLNLFIIR